MATRRKQTAIDIPASRAEADALVRDYARLEHRAGEVRGFAEVQIVQAKETRDAVLAIIENDQQALFARLKAYWEATGKDEAGRNRSLKVDGTEIGLRLTTPKLTFLNKMKEADVLIWFRGIIGFDKFIRTKIEIDKPAVIKALSDPDYNSAKSTLGLNLAVTQKDEFYISVAPLEKTKVEGKTP